MSLFPALSEATAQPDAVDQHPRILDLHIDGVPTRLLVSGGPEPVGLTMAEKQADLRLRHDAWRRALVTGPRGRPGLLGAWLTEAERPGSRAGVLFFDADGDREADGPGLVAAVTALAHLARVRPGPVRLDTTAGVRVMEFLLEGSVHVDVEPPLTATAHVLLDGQLILPADDPLTWGRPGPG